MTSLWFEWTLLSSGWAPRTRVIGAAGKISAIEAGVEARATDERHGVGLPGLGNLHSHAFQRGLAGLTERRGPDHDDFWTWRELMYQFVERVRPEDLEALTALAYADMLEGGFTHVGEFHYLHHDRDGRPFADPGELATRIAAAAAATGIGLTLLPSFYAHSGFGGREPTPRQQRFINDTQTFARILESSRRAVRCVPGGKTGVAPHSLRAVTPRELTEVIDLAHGEVVHMHVCEQMKEVEDCLAWSGLRPIEWLTQHCRLTERWCLVHATHSNASEQAAIAKSGAIVGLCPITEANLGDGIFAAREYLAAGGHFGIGTDSNIRLDAAEELRTLEYSQRLSRRARNVLAPNNGDSTGKALYEAALQGAARALEAPGGLQVGSSLDVVSLDTRHPDLAERSPDAMLDSWVFSGGRSLVDCVWRAGEKVVSGGRHRRRAAIVDAYRRALARLLA